MNGPQILLESRRFRVVRLAADTAHPRDIVRHPGAVVILPLLSDGRVVLIRNYRVSVEEWLVELPAGTLESNEDPLEAARRELAEETGYRAQSMQRITAFYSSPGILDERMHLFLATGLEPGDMALEGDEKIEPLPTAWDDALRMIGDGRIHDAKTLGGLLYYEAFLRHRARTS